jgi:hypothetical protein
MLRPHRAAFAALVLALSISGCGGDDKAAESAIEEAAENAGEDVDVDVDDDEITIENSDGSVTVGGDLPEGFPAEDIPLVDGDVLMAMGASGQGYQVTLDVDDAPADAMAAARALLEGAGFTVDEEGVMGTLYTATLSSDAYSVYLTATEADGRTTLIYAVEVA